MAKSKGKEAIKNTENLEESPAEPSEKTSDDIAVVEPDDTSDQESAEPEDETQLLRLELDEYKNLYLRKAAEFENFKKRKQQEFQTLIKSAGEALISDLLPVLDDFDRFIASGEEDNNAGFFEGARLIREKLWEVLASRGLHPIEALDQPFDPELHEALMQEERKGVEPGIVLQEHQRGYLLGDRVIRHAKVVVSA